MQPKRFLILLAVTLAVSMAALASYLAEQRDDTLILSGEPMLPELQGKVEAVAVIEVVTGSGSYTLERRDGAWGSRDDDGYPVRQRRVNRLLVGLTSLERLEAKTARPELHPRIHVEDPDGAGAASRLVRLKDREGTLITELVVGKQRHARTGQADHGTYVRRPDSAQAWLAAGFVDLWDETYEWLDSMVVDIEPGEIERIEILPAFGPRLLAVRPERGAESMGVAGVPQGGRLDREAVRDLGALLSGVRFDAVRPVENIDFSAPLSQARIVTFDGETFEVETARHEGASWLRLTAAPRHEGWAYRVQDYIARRLSRSLNDLLAEEGS